MLRYCSWFGNNVKWESKIWLFWSIFIYSTRNTHEFNWMFHNCLFYNSVPFKIHDFICVLQFKKWHTSFCISFQNLKFTKRFRFTWFRWVCNCPITNATYEGQRLENIFLSNRTSIKIHPTRKWNTLIFSFLRNAGKNHVVSIKPKNIKYGALPFLCIWEGHNFETLHVLC